MGHRWKRLLKPVKNFEKFFDFDLTWSSGTPPKGTRASQNRLLSNEARGAMWGVA